LRVVNGIVVPTPAALTPTQTLEIQTPGKFVTQQDGALEVTLVRKAFAPTGFAPNAAARRDHVSFATMMANAARPHPAPDAPILNEPLTVNVSATLNSTGPPDGQLLSVPSSGSDATAPNSVSVTFPAGVTTETVRVPINLGAADSGTVPVWISAASTSGPSIGQVVYLASGPDAVPPTMTSAQVIKLANHASGISITFSKPMAPATVENVRNYTVSSLRKGNTFLNPLASIAPAGSFMNIRYSALKAALYDPSTRTVTLIPTQPFNSSNGYTVQSAKHLAGHVITDLQGNPLYDPDLGLMNGKFQIFLAGGPAARWSPISSTGS
jgi:hypothetical protein